MANLVFIPQDTSKSGAAALTPLESIPQEVKDDVEAAYKALKINQGRFRAAFPSLGELNQYVNLVKAYCAQRPAGEIKFRKSPTRDLPKTTMDFRITDMETAEEAITNGINAAVDAVKELAAK